MASDAKLPTVPKTPENIGRFNLDTLPDQMMFDTTVWLRALGWVEDDRTKVCSDLLDAIEHKRLRALMAAPSLAELLRKDPKLKPPNGRHINVVAFDRKCAVTLQEIVAPFKNETEAEGRRVKFDAMIIASAVRWNCRYVVTLDKDFRKNTPNVGSRVEFRNPVDFLNPVDREIAVKLQQEASEKRRASAATAKLVKREGSF